MIFIKRLLKNWKFVCIDFFSSYGFLWLLVESVSYFLPNNFSKYIRGIDILGYLLFISFVFSIIKNIPKLSFAKKIRDKDSSITIKIGDIFKSKGAIVVPMNNNFDVCLNGNVKKVKSILCRFINDYYLGEEEHLKNDIGERIDISKVPYPAGTVTEIEQNKRKFFLLVNSKKNNNDRVYSDIDDFMNSLNGLWKYLANETGRDEYVNIPLINTQHGRNSDITREVVIKQIIDTFIDAMKYNMVCENIVIYIHANDLKKGDLNFDQLCKYLDFKCSNYKDIKFNPKNEGNEVEASLISDIKS